MTNSSTLAKELRPILPTNDLSLYLTVMPFADATKQESGVAIIVGVRGAGGRSDRSSPDRQNPRVLAAAFDQKANVVAVTDRGEVLSTPGGLAHEVLTSLVLRPGRYQIRVALEAGGKRVSVYSHVSVPDVSRESLSLTGPLISRGGTGSMPREIEDVFPLMPAGQREFTVPEPVRAWVRIHQGQQGPILPVRMRVAILNRTGRRLVVDDTVLDVDRFGPRRSADYLHELSVQGLEPSNYTLELECSAGAARVLRRLTFSTK